MKSLMSLPLPTAKTGNASKHREILIQSIFYMKLSRYRDSDLIFFGLNFLGGKLDGVLAHPYPVDITSKPEPITSRGYAYDLEPAPAKRTLKR